MTIIIEVQAICSNCGTESSHRSWVSTHTIGAPDLDERPAKKMRLTMDTWQQQCPSCPFVAPSLDENSTNVSALLVSEAYQSVLNDNRLPSLARRFICRGMIEEARKKWTAAARYLEAAWATDDAAEQRHDSEPQSTGELHELMMLLTADRPETIADRPNVARRAIELRKKSAELFHQELQRGRIPKRLLLAIEIKLVDILRRSEQWADADALCARLFGKIQRNDLKAILIFERQLIASHDGQVHTLDEALGRQAPREP